MSLFMVMTPETEKVELWIGNRELPFGRSSGGIRSSFI